MFERENLKTRIEEKFNEIAKIEENQRQINNLMRADNNKFISKNISIRGNKIYFTVDVRKQHPIPFKRNYYI